MAQDESNGSSDLGERAPFVSKLEQGKDRFLAHAIEHGLEVGRRTARDFIAHFPPSAIMEGLASRASLRAEILVHTTGIKSKIASKKSWKSAAEDLQIALDEKETDAEAIVAVFQPDDRVRYLDARKIWKFLTEGDFWNTPATRKEDYRSAKRHMAFMLERALADKLLTHKDIVDGLTVAEIAVRLPKSELGKIIEGALSSGKRGAPFTEVELLAAMPPEVAVEYIPLPHLWESVIVPRIAVAHGYTEGSALAPSAASSNAESDETESGEAPAPGASQDWSDMRDAGDEAVSEDEISDDDFAPS
jgi:hypothetical protein